MHSKGPTDLWNIVRRPGRASTSVTCCSDQSAGAAGYNISKCVTLAWKCSAILGYRPGWVNMSRYTSGHDARSGDIGSIVRHLSSIVLRLISCLMKSESSPQNSTPQTHVRKNTSSPMSAPSRESTTKALRLTCVPVACRSSTNDYEVQESLHLGLLEQLGQLGAEQGAGELRSRDPGGGQISGGIGDLGLFDDVQHLLAECMPCMQPEAAATGKTSKPALSFRSARPCSISFRNLSVTDWGKAMQHSQPHT